MAQHVHRGTILHTPSRTGDGPMDTTYVVERVVLQTDGTIRIEARTERQRIFGRALTGVTTWTEPAFRAAIAAGALTIASPRRGRPGAPRR